MNNYIFWPVMLNGKKHHITLKYLGDVDVPPAKVLSALKPFKNLLPNFYDIRRDIFTFKGEEHFVLELFALGAGVQEMHDALNFRPDDFPSYRPHVTVSKMLWGDLAGVAFGYLDFYIGMPRYYYNGVGYRFTYTFNESTNPKKEVTP